jgi:large subunit ribosomal protein L4
MHQVVVAQLAAARQGTHATKTRGAVSGWWREALPQKGTGRARQGSIRAPQFTGGGTVHGPQPRDYSQRTPKKMKAAALRGALSDRAREGACTWSRRSSTGDAPKTKAALATLDAITAPSACSWCSTATTPQLGEPAQRAAVHLIEAGQLNTYDVLVADEVVFTETALAEFVAGPRAWVARSADLATPRARRRPSIARRGEAPSRAPRAGPAKRPRDEAREGDPPAKAPPARSPGQRLATSEQAAWRRPATAAERDETSMSVRDPPGRARRRSSPRKRLRPAGREPVPVHRRRDANKTQIKIADEQVFDVKDRRREHDQPPGQAQAHAGGSGRASPSAPSCRCARRRIEIFGGRRPRDLRLGPEKKGSAWPSASTSRRPPGRRGSVVARLRRCHARHPEKSLVGPLHNTGGPQRLRRVTARHQGGGHKRAYR